MMQMMKGMMKGGKGKDGLLAFGNDIKVSYFNAFDSHLKSELSPQVEMSEGATS